MVGSVARSIETTRSGRNAFGRHKPIDRRSRAASPIARERALLFMASIFTYEPDTPRVSSPWLWSHEANGSKSNAVDDRVDSGVLEPYSLSHESGKAQGVTRLKAEPQDGPVEYKLHLLLRPRRKFRSTSTGTYISGSRHSRFGLPQSAHGSSDSAIESTPNSGSNTPSAASTQQTRQHRLEQLTTQLLWRLQQSSPHHTSSATNIILPSLPEALPELQAPQQPAKLLHGLEESQGALYEIGVSDDGTLVGLAEDEMHESLNNLHAMAACLGCSVEVLRRETVGDCEWLEEMTIGRRERKSRRTGKLVVAEALIKPHLQVRSPSLPPNDLTHPGTSLAVSSQMSELSPPATEQLRVTLTGPTMSGKSTLLGTLTTSTLDNGRGQSRLSMLKHRHEITSGITSSVTQELLGYEDIRGGHVEVVNYAIENVASWIDIHAAAAGSRLVLVSDSAGHPRYKRTTVKGLVGWAPHWTLLCVPADDTSDNLGRSDRTQSYQQNARRDVLDMDLSGAQLDLCLRLDLPLVVVITKLDMASRTGLRQTLSKVLDALKAAGRQPSILKGGAGAESAAQLQTVEAASIDVAYNACVPLLNDPRGTVPIVLTSAVQGTGISSLHALLHELPIPADSSTPVGNASLVFHIEDVYSKPAEVDGIIVSGHLRAGSAPITVGSSILIGPFSTNDQLEDSEDSDERPARRRSSHVPTSRSFPGALKESQLRPKYFSLPGQEWRRVEVKSIRNLRLPVHSLLTDQVGTLAIASDDEAPDHRYRPTLARIRKGMVLVSIQPMATRTFDAQFQREDLESLAVGNSVVVYIASVRASAKVVSARAPDSPEVPREDTKRLSANYDPFTFEEVVEALEEQPHKVAGIVTAPNLLVTFTFEQSKEFVLFGDQVLVMPGGGQALYGGHERGEKGIADLNGFVGRITSIAG